MEVGGHTLMHEDLVSLSVADARRQISTCKRTLEIGLNATVDHFAYPYGEFNSAVTELVQEAGYRSAVTTKRGRASPGDNMFMLRRISITRTTNIFGFLWKILTSYEDRKGI